MGEEKLATLRVVVPFTTIAPQTVVALNRARIDFERVSVQGDDLAYGAVLAALWADGEDFAIVEQDIEIRSNTFKSFDACPELWCAASYPYLGGEWAGLGCVRFRAELLERFPVALTQALARPYPTPHYAGHYCTMDDAIQRVLGTYGVTICRDHPKVGHLGNQWASHGCHGEPPPRT